MPRALHAARCPRHGRTLAADPCIQRPALTPNCPPLHLPAEEGKAPTAADLVEGTRLLHAGLRSSVDLMGVSLGPAAARGGGDTVAEDRTASPPAGSKDQGDVKRAAVLACLGA